MFEICSSLSYRGLGPGLSLSLCGELHFVTFLYLHAHLLSELLNANDSYDTFNEETKTYIVVILLTYL